jgi:hypothetical protein
MHNAVPNCRFKNVPLPNLALILQNNYGVVWEAKLITVAARSKAWNVFARLNAGIVGSNPNFSLLARPSTSYSFVVFSLTVTPYSAADNVSLDNMTCTKTESFHHIKTAVQRVTEPSSVFGMSQVQISTPKPPILTDVILWLFLIPCKQMPGFCLKLLFIVQLVPYFSVQDHKGI